MWRPAVSKQVRGWWHRPLWEPAPSSASLLLRTLTSLQPTSSCALSVQSLESAGLHMVTASVWAPQRPPGEEVGERRWDSHPSLNLYFDQSNSYFFLFFSVKCFKRGFCSQRTNLKKGKKVVWKGKDLGSNSSFLELRWVQYTVVCWWIYMSEYTCMNGWI